jgi:preprotein translocase subunit SecG
MLYTVLLIVFVFDCALLMLVILLQDSKGQGLAGAFGGGGGFSTSMLGGRGAATFLSKATQYLGAAFLFLCILMSLIGPGSRVDSGSVVMDATQQAQQQIPQTGLPLLPGATPTLPAGSGLPIATPPDTGGTGN